mmetsp:Transcript_5481/g.14258  ORF Transcript_5481/g.14258 Transcript_5481/m.14258 type:complete len:94 (+) Transcript_5481:255-536(+)|eukprot:jgi/Tetstr1/440330/TSEL_028667.t1
MSKKNKLSTRRRQHKADLEKEKADAIKKRQKADKKLQKNMSTELAKKAVFKKKKGIKLRKNMTIRGIKVVDSESRQAALAALQEEAENKMEQD